MRNLANTAMAFSLAAIVGFAGVVSYSRLKQDREDNRLRSVVGGIDTTDTYHWLVEHAPAGSLVPHVYVKKSDTVVDGKAPGTVTLLANG